MQKVNQSVSALSPAMQATLENVNQFIVWFKGVMSFLALLATAVTVDYFSSNLVRLSIQAVVCFTVSGLVTIVRTTCEGIIGLVGTIMGAVTVELALMSCVPMTWVALYWYMKK